ncbi:hypothetical protein ACOMHN_039915 [Nucella lapillus]
MSGGYPTHTGVLQSTRNYTWNSVDAVGRGATAVVYLGRHQTTGRVVAIKLFHKHLRYSHCIEDLPELKILRQLKHDNVIAVLGIEQELQDKGTALIMEYCEGGSVLSMLNQAQYRYGLPETQFLLVLYHVAAGMQYLRSAEVVHRDIKPANIMCYITEDGCSVYKLTDFGAARQLNDDEQFTSLYGTEEYLHPEMYEKGILRLPTEQQFDARVDLWSLGVTFYHVATGQLPYQPYGGRSNKETMYRIISQKEGGVISGTQQFEEGPIEWSRHLPPTCLLSSGVRQFLTPLLAKLMEANFAQILSYEAFFARVQHLKSLIQLNVFDYMHAAQHLLLLEPSATLMDLQKTVASLTQIPAAQQLLLVGGHPLEGEGVAGVGVDPRTPLSAYPTHLRDRDTVYYVFPRGEGVLSSNPPTLPPPQIPVFPEFLDILDIQNDTTLAHTCLSRGHVIKQHLQLIGQQQNCLLQGHLYLRMHAEARLQAVGEALQLIRQLVVETRKRFTTFYTSLQSIQTTLESFSHKPDPYLRDILQNQTLLCVQQKSEDRVEEIEQYRRTLHDKLLKTKSQGLQWSEQCQQVSCTSKVEHQLTVIGQIHSRFRRDRSVRHSLTPHDEAIHRFERQKLQETCTRMLSILTGHCVPARDRLHKQAWDFSGSLVKDLVRILKVEKNNDSVLNCQQLLHARLDKMEAKCRDEVRHLQEHLRKFKRGHNLLPQQQHLTKITDPRQSSVDEGLGTSDLGSGSRSGSSLQSLRLESEDVLCMITENLDLMKRLEVDSLQGDVNTSTSTSTPSSSLQTTWK